jgi:hypothetical protein
MVGAGMFANEIPYIVLFISLFLWDVVPGTVLL